MNENKLKELYKQEINAAAPDKDALWRKIESRLEPKPAPVPAPLPVPAKKPRFTPALFKGAAAVAAALVVLVGARVALVTSRTSLAANDAAPTADSSSIAFEDMEQANSDSAFSPDNGIAPNNEQSAAPAAPSEPLSYSDLEFTSYSETVIKCLGAPYGGEYFVEEEILRETDHIVSATVARVFESDDGESLCYELCDIEWQGEDRQAETLVVESRSAYPMRRGRRYLIPLVEGENGFRTAFDGVPQMEYTSDGGLVYYNGWSALADSESTALLYPQEGEEDFFYDRMRFSYTADIPALISKWLSENQ